MNAWDSRLYRAMAMRQWDGTSAIDELQELLRILLDKLAHQDSIVRDHREELSMAEEAAGITRERIAATEDGIARLSAPDNSWRDSVSCPSPTELNPSQAPTEYAMPYAERWAAGPRKGL